MAADSVIMYAKDITMEQAKIDRINQLARKAKTAEGLTDEEKAEQFRLRREYIAEWRAATESTLDNVYIVDDKGVEHKLKKK